jgi:hypothetical protein
MTDIADAFDDLVSTITDAAAFVRNHPFYGDSTQQAPAYAFLLAMLVARIEEHVVFDPDHPYFRVIDTRTREGGDNADQRYLITRLNGGQTYRIWGYLGSACRLEAQIYAGDPYSPSGDGRMAAYLAFEDLQLEPGGAFTITASPDPRPGNWLENPPDSTRMLIRQVYSDWNHDDPGHVHIDRPGHEGDLKPLVTTADMAARLRATTASFSQHVRLWPEFVRTNYIEAAAPNTISPLFDPGSLGGVPGRWMAHGTFDLADDEALIVTTSPAPGNYQGIQLCDLWFSSLEYASRQSSLTGHQARLDSDGRYRYVISATDPAIPNWLDTLGHRRGVILLRFDGATGPLEQHQNPTATKVPLRDLRGHLLEDTPTVTPQERSRQITARRKHVQRRFSH